MHDPIVVFGALLLLAILAGGLTLCVIKSLSRGKGDVDDEARQQAEELRSRAEALNRSSSQIAARTKRLEELLALQRREKDN